MITRDTKHGIVSGVCAGLAKWLDVDPLLVRLAFVVAFFVYGVGLLPYLILWLLMPKDE
jgi:phage shock protein PspC (stress-responsive transcriptional regulator)